MEQLNLFEYQQVKALLKANTPAEIKTPISDKQHKKKSPAYKPTTEHKKRLESISPMVGCNTAITWVENLKNVDDAIRNRVLKRMIYEFSKDIPVKPKFHKGKYGHKYDHYTCGNCGHGINIYDKFCPNCGFRIEAGAFK
ncbi:MAG: hypothetical protein K6F84_05620 [Lachnospiraceae bacterium]|nr:hypothetical protein [Lachnospiraceae bacterium]